MAHWLTAICKNNTSMPTVTAIGPSRPGTNLRHCVSRQDKVQ